MKFDAYEVALEMIRELAVVLPRIGKFDRDLERQGRRAAASVALNLREGNRRLKGDRVHLFSVAAGSADEVRGVIDVAEAFGYVDGASVAEVRALVDRELAMTYRLTH